MAAPPVEQTKGTQVIAVPWETFEEWFKAAWEPGEHIALIGPTGEGKSTFAVGILKNRKYVLALDPKGEDETLAASGFQRITSWPISNKMRDSIAEGKPCRLICGGSVRSDEDEQRLIKLMHEVLAGVRGEGRWTLYADEFQLLADRRMYGLDKAVEKLLIAARSKGTSVVTSFQAAAWVPKAATRQATFCVLWPTRDRQMIKAVAEAMGRTSHEITAAVDELPSYHVLVIPKRPRAPMVITKAPKL
jgi:energy-coupling factor transporter ATP-binding protein EcfA2